MLLVFILMCGSVSAWWSQFHGDAARTGRSNTKGPQASPVLSWKTRVGCLHWGPRCWLPGFTGTDSSPALSPDEKIVYIGSYDHYLYGVDVETGAVRWKQYGIERYRYSPHRPCRKRTWL